MAPSCLAARSVLRAFLPFQIPAWWPSIDCSCVLQAGRTSLEGQSRGSRHTAVARALQPGLTACDCIPPRGEPQNIGQSASCYGCWLQASLIHKYEVQTFSDEMRNTAETCGLMLAYSPVNGSYLTCAAGQRWRSEADRVLSTFAESIAQQRRGRDTPAWEPGQEQGRASVLPRLWARSLFENCYVQVSRIYALLSLEAMLNFLIERVKHEDQALDCRSLTTSTHSS